MSNNKQTPKEKAQELVDKFAFEVCRTDAKHCALVAVDEIIKVAYWNNVKEYWEQVKQEVEKYEQQ